MSKAILFISGLVFVVAGLFFLVVPFSTMEDWGLVLGNRTGNLITGIALVVVGGVLAYLWFRKQYGKGKAAPAPEKPVTPGGPAPVTPGAPQFVTPSTPAAPAAPATPTAPEVPATPKPPVPPAQ